MRSCLTQDSIRVGAGLPSQAAQCGTLMPDGTLPPSAGGGDSQTRTTRSLSDSRGSRSRSRPRSRCRSSTTSSASSAYRQSEAARNDALYAIRAQELKTTATVTSAYLTLQAQAQQVALQERTAQQAREALRLAEERYRVGLAPFLDVSDARTQFEQAESDRINAVYDFHKAYASLWKRPSAVHCANRSNR